MPIGPMDAMRSQEVTQIKHVESQRSQHQQTQISTGFQQMKKQESKKTVQSTKSETTEYRYDAKEKGNQSGQGSSQRKNKKKNQPKKPHNQTTHPGGIDIYI